MAFDSMVCVCVCVSVQLRESTYQPTQPVFVRRGLRDHCFTVEGGEKQATDAHEPHYTKKRVSRINGVHEFVRCFLLKFVMGCTDFATGRQQVYWSL